MTYIDKVLYLFPKAQGVMYWHSHHDGTPWDDPYEGLVYDNPNFTPPTREELDVLDETVVQTELDRRTEAARKAQRDTEYCKDLSMVSAFSLARIATPTLTFSQHLDNLERLADTLCPAVQAKVDADVAASDLIAASLEGISVSGGTEN